MRLDNPCLLLCDFGKCISQKFHMIHADRGQHLQHCGRNNIRGIQQSSHSGLQHNQITMFFLKIQNGKNRLYFKYRRSSCIFFLHISGCFCYGCHMCCQRFFVNFFTIDLYFFSVRKQCRGKIPSNPISCPGQNR